MAGATFLLVPATLRGPRGRGAAARPAGTGRCSRSRAAGRLLPLGRALSGRSSKRAVLSGGLFLAAGQRRLVGTAPWNYLQDVDGQLVWEEGNRRLALTRPARRTRARDGGRPHAGGRVYIGTAGDGLYLFEP